MINTHEQIISQTQTLTKYRTNLLCMLGCAIITSQFSAVYPALHIHILLPPIKLKHSPFPLHVVSLHSVLAETVQKISSRCSLIAFIVIVC